MKNPEIKIVENQKVDVAFAENTIKVSKTLWNKVGTENHEDFKILLYDAYEMIGEMKAEREFSEEKPSDDEIVSAVITDGVKPWLKLYGIDVE